MSQDGYNSDDYNINFSYEDFTDYSGYASDSGSENATFESFQSASDQDYLAQINARCKAVEALMSMGIEGFHVPVIEEYDFVNRVPVTPGQHQQLTDLLCFFAIGFELPHHETPCSTPILNQEEERQLFLYSRAQGLPNHPDLRFGNLWLGHNLQEAKGDNGLTSYMVPAMDPIHDPRMVRGVYPPPSLYMAVPFIIATRPDGRIDLSPPDMTPPSPPVYLDVGKCTLDEFIAHYWGEPAPAAAPSVSESAPTKQYQDSTVQNQGSVSRKRKRDD